PEPVGNALPIADTAHASPNYFRAIGLRLISGRFFTDEDIALNEKEKDGVAVVNQAFARQFFNGEIPPGQRLRSGDKKHFWEIIGVVSDYRPMGVENGTRPQIFLPYLRLNSATLILRAATAPHSLSRPIQDTIWSLDKDLLAKKIQAM